MKNLIISIGVLVLLASGTLRAQVQNALNFDGTDDKVEVAGASSLIVGASQISLSFWVNPNNTAINWPDYDGFAGFRNDVDADFYIVQHQATGLEARFRNSDGTAFEIIFSNLLLNTWQHLVFTYDGSMIRLYRNSEEVGSAPASGSISNSSVSLFIGDLYYLGTNFYLLGEIDELGIWTKALTTQEISCLYNTGINPNSSNLVLAYNFNEGIPGGNNTGLTALHPIAGSLQGTLNGFSLSGNTSNFVDSPHGETTINASICHGQSYQLGSQTYTQPGTYFSTSPSLSGCDSTVFLNLEVKIVNTSTTVSGITMYALQTGANYQWVNCNNNFSWIAGATGQGYTPSINGNYAVIVTYDGCSDTSICIPITTVGINENNDDDLNFYPNPVNNKLIIDQGNKYNDILVHINDICGRLIIEKVFTHQDKCIIDTEPLIPGIYFIEIQYDGLKKLERIIKE